MGGDETEQNVLNPFSFNLLCCRLNEHLLRCSYLSVNIFKFLKYKEWKKNQELIQKFCIVRAPLKQQCFCNQFIILKAKTEMLRASFQVVLSAC